MGERTPERDRLLAQVVRYHLQRAERLLQRKDSQRGLAAASGALLLIRPGELRPGLLSGSERSLMAAATAAARLGDEGQARGYYQLALGGRLRDAERREALSHLQALGSWQADTREVEPLRASADDCFVASSLALVQRDAGNVASAADTLESWVRSATELASGAGDELALDLDQQRAARVAMIIGTRLIVALYLRDGDASAARTALESEPYSLIPNQELVDALRRAEEGSAEAWEELHARFQSWSSSQDNAFSNIARGAAWGTSLELYRLAPDSVRAAMPIAKMLVENDAADVVPLLLRTALGERPNARELGAVLRLLQSALVDLADSGDVATARLAFRNMQELLELATSEQYQATNRAGVGNMYGLMGDVEVQEGELGSARELIARSVALNPSASALGLLATVTWQRGEPEEALRLAERSRDLALKVPDVLAELRAYQVMYDVLSSQGASAEPRAGAVLSAALSRALEARKASGSAAVAAGVERHLAAILERYGELEAARRASLRAEEKAGNDLQQLTETLLDAQRRALTSSDLPQGRAIMRRGLLAGLNDQDLTYLAIWQRLLERRVKAKGDGVVEEAFARMRADDGWTGVLRAWITGKIDDGQLQSRASSVNERVEAQFYAAIEHFFDGATDANREALRAVAASPGIHLIEVRMARDLLAQDARVKPPTLPQDLAIP